ncbi:hypothetical protein L6452_20681 [Arctium lappa]|uniref:Uncharacterized protein n=1 Tax=Arctium lappa TaxID=4217 RepID=A0ACB9BDC2_ARCLA|nr:hypothetical protein L6452_20681 [Arctium lappa]
MQKKTRRNRRAWVPGSPEAQRGSATTARSSSLSSLQKSIYRKELKVSVRRTWIHQKLEHGRYCVSIRRLMLSVSDKRGKDLKMRSHGEDQMKIGKGSMRPWVHSQGRTKQITQGKNQLGSFRSQNLKVVRLNVRQEKRQGMQDLAPIELL